MATKGRHRYRIIAGRWRGRMLDFPAVEGLRPTGDRIRETLFNWLQTEIVGARCLDTYSGSGALAFEALSRGAASVTALDSSTEAIRQLRDNASVLNAEGLDVVRADARQWLRHHADQPPFDLIFLDPPFALALLEESCALIASGNLLSPRGRVYLESPSRLSGLTLPPGWQLSREKRAGQVYYGLCHSYPE